MAALTPEDRAVIRAQKVKAGEIVGLRRKIKETNDVLEKLTRERNEQLAKLKRAREELAVIDLDREARLARRRLEDRKR